MKSASPKSHGAFLILLTGFIAAFAPTVNGLIAFREFDLDLRFALSDALMSLVCISVFLLPIQLGILFLIRRKQIRPLYRTLLVLSPVLVLTVPPFLEALMKPVDSKKRFAQRLKHPLPADATGWRAWYSHPPGESHYMFSFNTTPASTETLLGSSIYTLVENPPMLDPEIGDYSQLPIGGNAPPKGWPIPKTWEGLKVFSSRENNDYCYILTDGSKSRIFIMVGDT